LKNEEKMKIPHTTLVNVCARHASEWRDSGQKKERETGSTAEMHITLNCNNRKLCQKMFSLSLQRCTNSFLRFPLRCSICGFISVAGFQQQQQNCEQV
jgi:hypothetical protein